MAKWSTVFGEQGRGLSDDASTLGSEERMLRGEKRSCFMAPNLAEMSISAFLCPPVFTIPTGSAPYYATTTPIRPHSSDEVDKAFESVGMCGSRVRVFFFRADANLRLLVSGAAPARGRRCPA